MYNSKRYFQLTSEILLEYNYSDLNNLTEQEGNNELIVDLNDSSSDYAHIAIDKYNTTKNFYFDSDIDNLVLPVNNSDSRFVQCQNKYSFIGSNDSSSDSLDKILNQDITMDTNTDDILIDTFKLHFTSRNYLGDYDGFVIRAIIYDEVKNKISLFSHIIRRTDDVVINKDPMLINQKLYTTYLEFRIPSSDALVNYNKYGEKNLREQLSPLYGLMNNTPLVFTIYGITATYEYVSGYEGYKTEKINTIYVPIQDSYNQLSVTIEEATDGDYFKIYPVVDNGAISFSDYIYNLANGRLDSYIILHELTLTEYWTDYTNKTHNEITHREHNIINAAYSDEKGTIEVNEDELERVMTYRPVLMHTGRLTQFVIEDYMKIINTVDNTTIIKKSSFDSKENTGCSPKKYGRYLNKIYLGEIPAQVNVYNKNTNYDEDNLTITNGGSNVTIENHQHSLIGFIESINIGVSIEQIPSETLNE